MGMISGYICCERPDQSGNRLMRSTWKGMCNVTGISLSSLPFPPNQAKKLIIVMQSQSFQLIKHIQTVWIFLWWHDFLVKKDNSIQHCKMKMVYSKTGTSRFTICHLSLIKLISYHYSILQCVEHVFPSVSSNRCTQSIHKRILYRSGLQVQVFVVYTYTIRCIDVYLAQDYYNQMECAIFSRQHILRGSGRLQWRNTVSAIFSR